MEKVFPASRISVPRSKHRSILDLPGSGSSGLAHRRYPGPQTTDSEMKSKRTIPARPSARKPAAISRRPVPNPFPPATRHLGKRFLQFAELPEPERRGRRRTTTLLSRTRIELLRFAVLALMSLINDCK